jgi:putative transposase
VARKLRLQFECAIYHVINRGNYRQDVFASAGAAMAFEKTLAEACVLFSWRMHAYVIMRNHYHLALTTPQPNLVKGMHWLQGTFASRFNRLRSENGHLFQGRYQALLIENAAALLRVVDYIHLNPVRAKIVPADRLINFRWSSLRRFGGIDQPRWLSATDWLEQLGLGADGAGWQRYRQSLEHLAGDAAEQGRRGFDTMTRGWAIGTSGWSKAVAKEYDHLSVSAGVSDEALWEMKAVRWTETLARVLAVEKKDSLDIAEDPKGAAWKIKSARILRDESNAPYAWIADALNMGSPASVRVYVSRRI